MDCLGRGGAKGPSSPNPSFFEEEEEARMAIVLQFYRVLSLFLPELLSSNASSLLHLHHHLLLLPLLLLLLLVLTSWLPLSRQGIPGTDLSFDPDPCLTPTTDLRGHSQATSEWQHAPPSGSPFAMVSF